MTPVTKWLHVQYTSGDPWVLPIWSAVNAAAKEGRVAKLPDELGQLGLHIATRLAMAGHVIARLERSCEELADSVKTREAHHEFTEPRAGYGFPVRADLQYDILVDIDAMLFELNACCELMAELFERLHVLVGRPLPKKSASLSIRHILEAEGQDTEWFRKLDQNRNYFMHHATPYFAVDLSRAGEKLDMLIMKRNVDSFENEDDFIRYSVLQGIVLGFWNSKSVIQKYLVKLFEA